MANDEVHWHEGMFLRQHHFLTQKRQFLRVIHLDEQWTQHHNWGLRSIRLNTDALANFRFSVSALKARLRDGSLVEVPEDGPLPEIDLKPVLESNRRVMVHLGIPVLKSGHPNVSESGPDDSKRYYLVTQQLEDENLGVNPQPITIRRLNLKLLLSTENLAGYETIPLAQIEKSARADATPELDTSYIPPVLACEAWHELSVGILQAIYHRVGRKIEKLAGPAVAGGLSPDSLSFAQLHELNEGYACLTNLAYLEGIHPLTAYQELCRLVGQLAIFSPSRRPPEIPRYNHDDLGGCFYRLKNYLDDLLSIVPEPDYQERSFMGEGLRMQVALERDWLEQGVQMYIGVHSPLEAEECVDVFVRQINMKVGSSERVDMIYRMGLPGLKFAHVPVPSLPQSLRGIKGVTYFQINRDLQQNEWQSVKQSKALAIRFNENHLVGNIDHQERIKLRVKTEMPVQFILYVMAPAEGGPAKA